MAIRAILDFFLLKKVKSVKTKTMLVIVPLVVTVLAALIAETFVLSMRIIQDQTEQKMKLELSGMTNMIEAKLVAHSKATEAMGKAFEANFRSFSLPDFQKVTQETLDVSENAFGLGVFAQPFKKDPKAEFFSTYTYREQDGHKKTTEEYSDPSYNYPGQDWYKIVGEKGENGTQFTAPYYDPGTNVTMVTVAVPLFDDRKSFLGVATGDLNLTTIQKIIGDVKIGDTGWAFLIDAEGTYMAGAPENKIMKAKIAEDDNPSLAALGKEILGNGSGENAFQDGNGLNHVFYSKLPSANWYLAVVMPDKEMGASLVSLLRTTVIISAIGILLLIAAVYLFSRSITGQIRKVNALSEYMSNGDFTHVIDLKSSDEFGTMSRNFNRSTEIVRQMLRKVSESTLHVAATSEQLSAGAEETTGALESVVSTIQSVAGGAENQLSGTEETAKALEEMSVGIQRIAESASEVSESCVEAAHQAADGNERVQMAVRQMGVISRSVQETSEVVRRLDRRSQEIGMIVGVISDISARTNLLALNASIEAARAGEHGRGFAVVASEVKKLAEQTKQSAEQVVDLIRMIQEDVVDAVQVMNAGSIEVSKGTEMVSEAGKSFETILIRVQEISSEVQEVSAASEQMSAGSEEVTASVTELAKIAKDASMGAATVAASSEEQMAAMEQVASSAVSLSGMVQELQSLLVKFKV
ncbi:methyl-accepting chemotaxis protein [Cohnella sp. CFH 77786]|uniref:methyl-accepting chemotaxis protein n=1 Tax=Cohnella sp. CFH 77786 TaxID=2662265 RepID=UPI001C60E65B|nr:methyl-accepting chemotaxis protein [Cohnella sp. CFH 77786]